MEKLLIPSLKGKIGDWVYFNATMRLKNVANKKRIATVSEVEELYSKNINEILQRDINNKRISKLSQYLQTQKDHFLSSIIVAIFKGSPKWSEIRIEDSFEIEGNSLSTNESLYLDGRLGILSLNGDETLFVLDGQHRLIGIRDAYKASPEFVGNDDISITFVIHSSQAKPRTRRLFTVLNRYAEKPKKAELIIMEEDDAAAIITRRLASSHLVFKKDNAIASTKAFAMPPSDTKSFITLVALYEIVKIIIDFGEIYPTGTNIYRLEDEQLEELYEEKIMPYWNFIFSTFPQIEEYIDGNLDIDFIRNKEIGGSLLLRPLGQLIIAQVYKIFLKKSKRSFEVFKSKIGKVNFDLSDQNWKYVFWNGSTINSKSPSLKKLVLLYILGEPVDKPTLDEKLKKLYREHNSKYNDDITPVEE